MLLAVYGTLKKGHHNHEVHLNRPPIYANIINLNATMYSNGRYPMLIRSDQNNDIFIEIYELTQEELLKIDELETPFGYSRSLIELPNFDPFWIYYYDDNKPPQEFHQIISGNFEKEIEW